MTDEQWGVEALKSTILRGVVGSTAHGVHIPGTDDRDEMAVCLPCAQAVLGLDRRKHLVVRDAPEGERSRPGDLDLTIYSLHRYIELMVLKANPTCQILLWLPESMLSVLTPIGEELRRWREAFVCQSLGRSFIGYMAHQRQRLTGERGQKRVKRPELVEQFGFDTKYAAHVVRLGLQGVEMMARGKLTLPMPEAERDEVMAIRTGKTTIEEVVERSHDLEKQIAIALEGLPENPPRQIELWMVKAHIEAWK